MDEGQIVAVCNDGHTFLLTDDFTPEIQVIAALSWCPEMVVKPEHGNLVLECGSLVLWKRYGMKEHWPGKRFRLPRDRQLDLFDDRT